MKRRAGPSVVAALVGALAVLLNLPVGVAAHAPAVWISDSAAPTFDAPGATVGPAGLAVYSAGSVGATASIRSPAGRVYDSALDLVAPRATPRQQQLFDADDFLAPGARRADLHGGNWQTGNVGESVSRFGGTNPQVSYSGQKTIIMNTSDGLEIIVDNAGGYYRIRRADGVYRMLDGSAVPPNVPILRPGGGSALSGVPKDVRQALTHFWTGQS